MKALNPLFQSTKVKRDVNDRAGIIGGSGAGACLGLSTYQTEYEAYQRFIGVEQVVDEKTQERFDMGHELEDFIADQIMRIEGIKLMRDNFAHVNDAYPFLICHPDRIVVGLQDGKRIAVEIKSSSAFDRRWGDEDTDQIPMDYLVQCYSYFYCNVCEEVWLYRFSNNALHRYKIKYDEVRVMAVFNRLVEWAKKVMAGYIPSPTSYKDATARWDLQTEGDLEADEEALALYDKLTDVKSQIKELKNEEDQLKAKMVEKMDGHHRLVSEEKKLCTYTQVTTTRFDSTAFKKDHKDLYDEYAKTTTSMRLV